MPALKIAVIVASTRTNRFADLPLEWVREYFGALQDFELDVIDLREHPLPPYDLPASPAAAHRDYVSAEQAELGRRFDAADGFIVIANEYNHGYSAALKNTLDYFYIEFVRKPIGYLAYGNVGGGRVVEQLRLVAVEQQMVPLRAAVHILGPQMGEIRAGAESRAAVYELLAPRMEALADDLTWWGTALSEARAKG